MSYNFELKHYQYFRPGNLPEDYQHPVLDSNCFLHFKYSVFESYERFLGTYSLPEYEQIRLLVYALNCASEIFHFHEIAVYYDTDCKYTTTEAYRDFIISDYHNFSLLNDLSDVKKHGELTRKREKRIFLSPDNIKNTVYAIIDTHGIEPVQVRNRQFALATDNREIDLADLLKAGVNYWISIFKEQGYDVQLV